MKKGKIGKGRGATTTARNKIAEDIIIDEPEMANASANKIAAAKEPSFREVMKEELSEARGAHMLMRGTSRRFKKITKLVQEGH